MKWIVLKSGTVVNFDHVIAIVDCVHLVRYEFANGTSLSERFEDRHEVLERIKEIKTILRAAE